jgi:DNA-binding Lrp family transcriptional regulator
MTTSKNSILNEKDIMILEKLIDNGRKTSASISSEIDLGKEMINYRIKKLVKENLIV